MRFFSIHQISIWYQAPKLLLCVISLNIIHLKLLPYLPGANELTHWGEWCIYVMHIYKLTNIGSDNGLSPGRRQAIIWTNAGILLIGPLGTSFSENSIEIHTFSFNKMHLKMSSAKWHPFCLRPQCVNKTGLYHKSKYNQSPILKTNPNKIWPIYRQISNIRCTKSPNINVSCLILQSCLPNPLKPGVKLRMKM